MKRRHFALSIVSLAAGSACSGQGSSPPPAPASPDLAVETGDFVVAPGDQFECFYTDVTTDRELNVTSADGTQGPGAHHLTIYYAETPQQVGHHPCVDQEMVVLHQVAALAGNKEGLTIQLPPGYATKVPAGKQIVVQSHYINTTGAPETVNDRIAIHTLLTTQVVSYVNSFVLVDSSFTVPPKASATSVTECLVPRDFQLLFMLGHMHENGSHYKVERVDDQGNVLETLYDTPWDPAFMSHPPLARYTPDKPLVLKGNTRLRQTCTWDNSTADELRFPEEMCVMFSYYFPDDGWVQCETKAVSQ